MRNFDIIDILLSVIGRLFGVSPQLTVENGEIVAKTGWKAALLTLGFSGKTVLIQPRQKTIRIDRRLFWFAHVRQRIEFDWVQAISYRYFGGGSGVDGDESFKVALKLKDGKEVFLFTFSGSQGFVNNSLLPDWMFPAEQAVGALSHGNQESDSLTFVDVLERLIGVPLDNSL